MEILRKDTGSIQTVTGQTGFEDGSCKDCDKPTSRKLRLRQGHLPDQSKGKKFHSTTNGRNVQHKARIKLSIQKKAGSTSCHKQISA